MRKYYLYVEGEAKLQDEMVLHIITLEWISIFVAQLLQEEWLSNSLDNNLTILLLESLLDIYFQ